MKSTMPASGNKHPMGLIAAAAGVSAVLGLLATLLAIGYLRQKELRQAAHTEALRARDAAAQARDAANRRLRARDQAEELAGFLLDDLRDELIQLNRSDLLGAAAEKAVKYFEQLPAELVTPETQARHASVLMTLSDARYQQGNERGAIAAATRAIEMWKRLAAAGDPDGNYTIRLGRALGELGLYQYQSENPYAARDTYLEMIRLYDNAPSLKDSGWRDHGLAKAHMGLGEMERLEKNYTEAQAEFQRSLAYISRALTSNSNELSWLQMFMTLHNNIGVAFMHQKEHAKAEDSFSRAVEPNRRLIRLEPKNRRWEKELATTLLNLGALLQLQTNYARAEPYVREALALRQGLVDWDPKSTRAIRKLAHAWHRMTMLYFDIRDCTNALAGAHSSFRTLGRLLDVNPSDTEAIREIQEYAEKYRDRLMAAGMSGDAADLIREITVLVESRHPPPATAASWQKLIANLRAATTTNAPAQNQPEEN